MIARNITELAREMVSDMPTAALQGFLNVMAHCTRQANPATVELREALIDEIDRRGMCNCLGLEHKRSCVLWVFPL